ncbi:hypothetical protein [Geomonas edaphica]|uniref:hypothetical protein n=1 Tax=Geomonas edaphica TaxID=2570226 RepID=UPI0010A7D8F8|nr:hypothetical protein [Geomonas edaphica]
MARVNVVIKMDGPLSRLEVIEKYPEIPPLVILKADVQRRGVYYSDAALAELDLDLHAITGPTSLGRVTAGSQRGRCSSAPSNGAPCCAGA